MSTAGVESRFLVVDGIRTHYLECGRGEPLVLLHGGAPGDCAAASWEHNLGPLSEHYRVLAPDWLGYGETDKVRDFGDPLGKPVTHMARLLEELGITTASFVGLSMGGTLLVRDCASATRRLPVRRMILVSGGGFSPDNEARRLLQTYDGSFESMRAILRCVHFEPSFADDEEFVARRHAWSLVPGAFEHFCSQALRPPAGPSVQPFGKGDPTAYENVDVPTLITAGADDPLRVPGYAHDLAARIPDCEAIVFERCGHVPNLEHADEWNAAAIAFLDTSPGDPA